MSADEKTTPLRLTLACLVCLSVSAAHAQTTDVLPPLPDRLPAFGRSVAGTNDATSLVVNPANLAFLAASELRWSSVYLDDRALAPYQGHAFSFAFPISFLSLATGLRLDLVNPPDRLAASTAAFRENYQWLTTALAFRLSETSALGVTYKHAYSDNGLVGGLDSWSGGFTTRPWNFIGASVVANEIGSPSSRSGEKFSASYDMAIALRPFGSQVVL